MGIEIPQDKCVILGGQKGVEGRGEARGTGRRRGDVYDVYVEMSVVYGDCDG